MKHAQLSNVQVEILKLYSTNLSERELLELKKTLAKFYARRAIKTADKLWQEKKLSNEDMEAWLHEG